MTDLIQYAGLTIDQAITVWLDEKTGHSGSQNTRRSYAEVISRFRAACQSVGLDLDGAPARLALVAQGWLNSGNPKPATYQQRRAVLSSFYVFVQRRRLLPITENPAALLDQRKVQRYANLIRYTHQEVRFLLDLIDRSKIEGKRDYALLVTYFMTGRRLTEIVRLRWGDDVLIDGDKNLLLTMRAKGNKVVANRLITPVSAAIMTWLSAWYGAEIPAGAPLWVSLSRFNRGQALGSRGVSVIMQKRLGTTKVHALRHTFAMAMVEAGAPMNEIQDQLGHESLDTTGRYVKALRRAENPYSGALARLYGLEE